LIIGGGLSGMSAALEIARSGFEVHLVEKDKHLGGHLRRIHRTLIGVDPQETFRNLEKEILADGRIKVHLNDTVAEVKGYIGNFESTLKSGEKVKHGTVVVATGAVEYEPAEYLFGKNPKVIRQTDLGEMISEKDFKAKSVVIIQCVGSRDEEHPNCSRICCSTAMANALKIRTDHPETSVYVLYRDIRTYGFREGNYNEAARLSVTFLRYDPSSPPKVFEEDGQLVVQVDE
ncbi:MAG TPA: NAD(P)-binding protein, partial [Thermoplasmata archaeon]|nr:NAD(P)-binding protein [Thermoplasmata archaeon]